jgi:hypothetical protein
LFGRRSRDGLLKIKRTVKCLYTSVSTPPTFQLPLASVDDDMGLIYFLVVDKTLSTILNFTSNLKIDVEMYESRHEKKNAERKGIAHLERK